MSQSEVALLSRHAKGMAVGRVFGRPRKPQQKVDVFGTDALCDQTERGVHRARQEAFGIG
jgi:hypothetical protein